MDCKYCSINDKLDYCCRCEPETYETKNLKIDNETYRVCPELNKDLECSIYERRPDICREWQCPKKEVGYTDSISDLI